jgi:hypothetical protein
MVFLFEHQSIAFDFLSFKYWPYFEGKCRDFKKKVLTALIPGKDQVKVDQFFGT